MRFVVGSYLHFHPTEEKLLQLRAGENVVLVFVAAKYTTVFITGYFFVFKSLRQSKGPQTEGVYFRSGLVGGARRIDVVVAGIWKDGGVEERGILLPRRVFTCCFFFHLLYDQTAVAHIEV